jgi:hypothetical protein
MDECVVQGLSLAIVSDAERRKAVLQDAEQVVIDYRGDLPNLYLPMMLGGYKVGVYRRGNSWPIWMSIQPTYDLALKEAEKLREQVGIPQSDKAIVAVEELANSVKVKRDYKGLVGFIQSDESFVKNIRSVLTLSIGVGILVGVGIGWLLFR